MDDSQGLVVAISDPGIRYPTLVEPLTGLTAGVEGLSARRCAELESIIISKTVPGFSAETIQALRDVVRQVAEGRLGRVKYLVFDLAHDAFALSNGEDGFVELLVELESLILAAPAISMAFVRADLAGADLEFALACSMMVTGQDRRFSFAADPLVSAGAYAILAQKVGFVRAERLMERGEIVGAAQMHEMCLVRDVLDGEAAGDVEAYLSGALRRHNASYGIYRAQRIAIGSAHEALRAPRMA